MSNYLVVKIEFRERVNFKTSQNFCPPSKLQTLVSSFLSAVSCHKLSRFMMTVPCPPQKKQSLKPLQVPHSSSQTLPLFQTPEPAQI